MITRSYPRTRRGLLPVTGLTAALVGAALSTLSPRVGVAQTFPQSCAGTYLIREDGTGILSTWVLGKDGAFLGSDSFQRRGNFSDQQGSWERDGNQGIKGVLLDFTFDGSGELINIGRNDIAMHMVGSGCDNVAGTITLRFFEAGEDPLNPASDTGQPITETFTGRRVRVSP
jgi:hypothetical protein